MKSKADIFFNDLLILIVGDSSKEIMNFDVKGGAYKGHTVKERLSRKENNFRCRDAVEYLLKFEASANVADKKGCYALHLASWSGHAEICEILLSRGPSIAKPSLQVRFHTLYPQGVLCYILNF